MRWASPAGESEKRRGKRSRVSLPSGALRSESSWPDPVESYTSMELIKTVLGWQAGALWEAMPGAPFPQSLHCEGGLLFAQELWLRARAGNLSAGGNKLKSVLMSAEPSSRLRLNDMNVNPCAHLMTHAYTQVLHVSTYTLEEMRQSVEISQRNGQTWQILTSVIMKKSSPGSPCTTIFSPSSNWTGSKASATVRRSHLSKDSVNKAH